MDLKIIPTEETEREDISIRSLKYKAKTEQVEYEVPEVELSQNIQKFDKRPRVYTQNPFAYNSVGSKKKNYDKELPSKSSSELLTDVTYNTLGKFLGVDTIHDWNKYADKVYAITEWAKMKSGETKIEKLMDWLAKQSKLVPNMGAKEIDNLYLYAKLYLTKK
jgi:hypothetical protein